MRLCTYVTSEASSRAGLRLDVMNRDLGFAVDLSIRPAHVGLAITMGIFVLACQQTPQGSGSSTNRSPAAFGSPTVQTPVAPDGADLLGHVVDAASGQAVGGADVTLAPYGRHATADSNGLFSFKSLGIASGCRWVGLKVIAARFGVLNVVDDPLYPGHNEVRLELKTRDAIDVIGPPLAEKSMGQGYCAQ
jgi:hypothetical protein